MTWNPDVDEPKVAPRVAKVEILDLDTLDDGRCKASSWRGPIPRRATYENHFGPGGFNRCKGSANHVNSLHCDEWGNVFRLNPFRVIRKEPST